MTPEQIDNLEAGRELDMLIAENVMGYSLPPHLREYAAMGVFSNDSSVCPHYSTDIAAAWQVVEKLREPISSGYYEAQLQSEGEKGQGLWTCWFGVNHFASANTAPLAICKAALKAVSVAGGRFNENMHRDFDGEQDKLLYRQLERLLNKGKQPLANQAVDDLEPEQPEQSEEPTTIEKAALHKWKTMTGRDSIFVPVMPHRWHTEPHSKCWCLEPQQPIYGLGVPALVQEMQQHSNEIRELWHKYSNGELKQPEEQEYSYSYRVPGCNNEPNPTNGYHCPRCRVDLEPEGMPK